MNKPASKEPSMDEILSSIRQIIADDDAAVAPARPTPAPATSTAAAPTPRPFPTAAAAPKFAPPSPPPAAPDEPAEPLALSPEQILYKPGAEPPAMAFDADEEDEGTGDAGFASFAGEPELVDPDDVAFEPDAEEEEGASFSVALEESPEETEEPPPAAAFAQPAPPPRQQPLSPPPEAPRQQAPREEPPRREAPRAAPSMAQHSPMPDPQLSRDLAEELLAPTTGAAVKHTLSRLSGLSMVGSNVTLEDMIRDLLRPMLKEWLDENLPSVVERMVEKEISRISRGE